MQTEFSNFSRYDEKGRRVAIFGSMINDKEMVITIIPCSLKDQFSRKTAKFLYNKIDSFKENKKIQIEEFPKKTFIKWCRENYYRKVEETIGVTGLYSVRYGNSFKMNGVRKFVKIVKLQKV